MEGISVEFELGAEGWASDSKRYLPEDSEALSHFREPVTLSVRYDPPRRVWKVFEDGISRETEDTTELVGEFSRLWVEVLNTIGQMSGEVVQLTYFLGEAAHLFGLWPLMPADYGDNRRFFASQMCKDSRQQVSVVWGRVCVEYSYDEFKRFTGLHEFFCSYGRVMGAGAREANVGACLPLNTLDKEVLEQALKDEGVRCWWFCDPDFDGMTIWHKDLTGSEILNHLREEEVIREK